MEWVKLKANECERERDLRAKNDKKNYVKKTAAKPIQWRMEVYTAAAAASANCTQ